MFFFAPLALTVAFSFGHSSFGEVRLGFTFSNYAKALTGFNLAAFLRTLEFAAVACALCLLVAFPAALFIARRSGRVKAVGLALVLTPYFTSFLIRVMSWQILLARDGPLQIVLNALHLYDGPVDLMDTQTAVLIGMVYSYLPIAIVPLFVVLARIPQCCWIDASRDLGAGRNFEDVLVHCHPTSGQARHCDGDAADRRADAGGIGDPEPARRKPRRADGPGHRRAIHRRAGLCARLGDGGAGVDRRRRDRRRARPAHARL